MRGLYSMQAWQACEQFLIYPIHNHLMVHHHLRQLLLVDDKQHGHRFLHIRHRRYRLVLDYFLTDPAG